MLKNIVKEINNPDIRYRGIPFWSWNDRLDPEELRWQIKQMEEAGLGGYFMHARAGLQTPYLEEEWMNCVNICIDEGHKHGLKSWLYDENGYPSGFAAGKLPSMGVGYQQKFLKFEILVPEAAIAGPSTLGFYRTDGDYGRIDPARIQSGESVLHAYYEVNPYFTDLLDEKVVKKFIELTYDVYYNRFKEHFGDGIPGIFTDEPQYGRAAVPWSFVLPEKFQELYGYCILDFLSALYYNTPTCRKVRYDFWSTVSELFTGAVARQLGKWCGEKGCKLTGHILLEENIQFQTMCSGSAMGFYRHMQIPGIDWLGRDIGNPVIVKQVASVAEQLGKEQVLSEMFAAAGWGVSLEELKRIAEWQYSLGVNIICAHLEGYSLRGMRKRDHPPGLFYQTNWWKEYRKFNDYFARLGMLLSEGAVAVHILVVHPLRSGWIAFDESCCNNGANKELEYIDNSFAELSEILSGLHLNYHYGDEEIISDYGSVKNGEFVIGNCSYRAVIVPPAITLEPDTVRLLKDFIKAGGKAFAFEDFPYTIRGVEAEEIKTLKKHFTLLKLEPDDIRENLEEAYRREISVLDEKNREIGAILHKISLYQDGAIVFLLNTEDHLSYNAMVRVKRIGYCCSINLEDCSVTRLPAVETQDYLTIQLSFAPCQSYVIAITNEPLSSIGFTARQAAKMDTLNLSNVWEAKACGLNSMTLDYCQYSVDNGEWSGRKPVIAVQKELLEIGRSTDIALKFTFDSACSFDKYKEMYLVIEEAGKYLLEINKKQVKTKADGWWKDKSFQKIDISGRVKKGLNTVVLKTHFHSSPQIVEKLARAKLFEAEMNMLSFESEAESIYLLGEFTVTADQEYIRFNRRALIQQGKLVLDKQSKFKCNGEITDCGYPFYCGNFLLEQLVELKDIEKFGSIIYKMDRPDSALSRLYVNGIEVKTFLWAPYEADIRSYVKDGVNKITLELIGTDRNLFGPHHHPEGELHCLGPACFTDAGGWRDSYCFISFGIKGTPLIQCYQL